MQHLPRIHYDHSPLLLTIQTNTPKRNSIFRFETMWLSHQDFPKIVNHMWNTNPPLIEVVEDFTKIVQVGNKDT